MCEYGAYGTHSSCYILLSAMLYLLHFIDSLIITGYILQEFIPPCIYVTYDWAGLLDLAVPPIGIDVLGEIKFFDWSTYYFDPTNDTLMGGVLE